ncbi:universal stress protein [Desulfurobacterium sp.]
MGFRKLLVAVDNFSASFGAFKKAVEIAREEKIPLTVVNVEESVPLLPAEKMLEAPPDHFVTDDPLGLAKAYASKYGVKVKTVKKTGPIAGKIIETAEEEDADLIILGDSGIKGVEKLYLGSIAQSVVENSRRPVLIVRKGWMNIEDVLSIARSLEKQGKREEIPCKYDPALVKENFRSMGTLFFILCIIYFFAAIITSKPFKNVAALEIAGLPFGIWSGIFLVISGIILTRIYINKQIGGETQ